MSEGDILINGKPIKDLKVAQLKQACKERNLPHSGNKATIIKRLTAAIELEGLKKSAQNSEGSVQPNLSIGDNSTENDFVKQYLENQRKMLQKQHHRFSSASEAESEDDQPKKHLSQANASPAISDVMSPPKEVMKSPAVHREATVKTNQEKVTIHRNEASPCAAEESKEELQIPDQDQEVQAISEEEKSKHVDEGSVLAPQETRDDFISEKVNDADQSADKQTGLEIDPPQVTRKQPEAQEQEKKALEPVVEECNESTEQEDKETTTAALGEQHKEKEEEKVHNDHEHSATLSVQIEMKSDAAQVEMPSDTVSEEQAVENTEDVASQDQDVEKSEAIPEDDKCVGIKSDEQDEVKNMVAEDGPLEQEEATQMQVEKNEVEMNVGTEEGDVAGVPVISVDEDVLMEEIEELDYDEGELDKSQNQNKNKERKIHHTRKEKNKKKRKEKHIEEEDDHMDVSNTEEIEKSTEKVTSPQEKENLLPESNEASDINAVNKPKLTEDNKAAKEEEVEVKPIRRRISIKKNLKRSMVADQPREKKRRWGKSSTSDPTQINISTDSLKDIIDVSKDAISEEVVDLEPSPEKKVMTDQDKSDESEEEGEIVEEVIVEEEVREEEEHYDEIEEEVIQEPAIDVGKADSDRVSKKAAHVKKSSSKSLEKTTRSVSKSSNSKPPVRISKPERDVSPARKPRSCILHVSNLVRPFALSQLKQLLCENGDFITDSFWINNIKSHCFVAYESEEIAQKTRIAIHRLQWPTSSPKKLVVDFSTEEEVEWNKKEQPQTQKQVRERKRAEVDEAPIPRKMSRQEEVPKDPSRVTERNGNRKERERGRSSPRNEHRHRESRREHSGEARRHPEEERGSQSRRTLREWDRVKLDQDEGARRRQDPEARPLPPSESRRSRHEEAPQPPPEPPKLLDDLFRKTTTVPCVYWLPLTDELIEERAKERELRREERANLRKKEEAAAAVAKNQEESKERSAKRDESKEDERRRDERKREERRRNVDNDRPIRREMDQSRGRREEERRDRDAGRRQDHSSTRKKEAEKGKPSKSMEEKSRDARKKSSGSNSSGSSDSGSSSDSSSSSDSDSSESGSDSDHNQKVKRR